MDLSTTYRKRGGRLPFELYDSVVRSLHGDRKALFVGKLATWISILAVWYRVQDDWLLVCAGFLVIFGLLRIASIVKFHELAKGQLDVETLRNRQRIYRQWAGIYVGLLGFTCFVVLAVTNDDLAHLMVISTTLAYIIGIAGRNFASAKVVNIQVIAVSIPLISGLVAFGEAYHTLLAMLLLPFLFAMHSIADRLREMLFNAVFTAMDNKTIANRFEVALRNASHGMAMIDEDGGVMVANGRFGELLGAGKSTQLVGKKLYSLASYEAGNKKGRYGQSSLTQRIIECTGSGEKQRFTHIRADGVTLEASFNPMTEGSGVIVLEDISERVNSENEIRKLANFDPLTHLANRRYFTNQIHELRDKDPSYKNFSVFFMDLDKFKDINDSLGHTVGDKLLCAASLRMKSCLPEDGKICRFGGDEFVILLPDVISREECADFANKVIDEVSKPILIDGHFIIVGASVGISQCPHNSTDLENLLKMADVSLYEAKSKGRGTHFFYSEELGRKIEERQKLEVDLRRSIERGELSLHYQPLIDLKKNCVSCCEALVRWNHPEKGMIPPSVFIPMAEEIGMISKIGKFVLGEATRECTKWPSNIGVAVNVSSLQFQQTDVCNVVTKALIESGLNPTRLEIEVTESAVIGDLAETSRVLRSLAQSGVKISLDDFGTGFSSLSYLHQLPLDKVKIDRSFVETIRDDKRSLTLLSGVTRMAADIGLTIIVEGVEEIEQLDLLKREVHLDQVQGFLFGKPMTAEQMGEFITSHSGGQNIDDRLALNQ